MLWRGRPTLYDAIEFDEKLATIDTVYDLAFLLMDLDFQGLRPASNTVLNRYLGRSREDWDLPGLAGLPLFLALRAAIRARVTIDRAAQEQAQARNTDLARARGYLQAALDYVDPTPPQMFAVGGLSGTGGTGNEARPEQSQKTVRCLRASGRCCFFHANLPVLRTSSQGYRCCNQQVWNAANRVDGQASLRSQPSLDTQVYAQHRRANIDPASRHAAQCDNRTGGAHLLKSMAYRASEHEFAPARIRVRSCLPTPATAHAHPVLMSH